MLRNKSVVSLLRDREYNIKYAPYISSLKIASQLIRSDKELYTNFWTITCPDDCISYENGFLYFPKCEQFCAINAFNKARPPFFSIERSNSKTHINCFASYSGKSVYIDVEDTCNCKSQQCSCFSQYFLSLSKDNWLCQYLITKGTLMKQVYVNGIGCNIKLDFIDWDLYGKRFYLTSNISFITDLFYPPKKKSDVVTHLAVFTTFPIEFLALIEIKCSIFGENISQVKISKQSLIIGFDFSHHIAIYNFDDFLKEGRLIPYKLGDIYENKGVIGCYPTGLPLNFMYNNAPPLLLKVEHGLAICGIDCIYGGHPYQYMTVCSLEKDDEFDEFLINSAAAEIGSPINVNRIIGHNPKCVKFHPDHSNRLIVSMYSSIDFYKIITDKNNKKISNLFSLDPADESFDKSLKCQSINTEVKQSTPHFMKDFIVLNFKYQHELDIFAILANRVSDDAGFVKLYDNVTGECLRTVKLMGKYNRYWSLHIDLHAIILIETYGVNGCNVEVYMM